MKKVTIAGTTYLGNLKKNSDGTFCLRKAFNTGCTQITKKTLTNYLQAKNNSELEKCIEFGGQGNTYTVAKLTKAQKLDLKVCKLNMLRAKALAAPTAENEVFRGLMGK